MNRKLSFSLLFYFFMGANIHSQTKISASIDVEKNREAESRIFNIYLEQLDYMYRIRGYNRPEIDVIISQYQNNNINSVQDFADNLALLYSKEQGLAVLFFFFSQDTLRSYLFEPGKLIVEKIIPITSNELIVLREDILRSLRITDLSKQRAPQLRGIVSPQDTSNVPVFSAAVEKATKLLFPSEFDEKYKHLLIVPALNLGVFPFHLLKPYADGSYLIEKCGFTVAPTLHDALSIRVRLLKTQYGIEIKRRIDYDVDSKFVQLDDYNRSFKSNFPFRYPLFVCNPTYPVNEKYYFPDLPGAEKEIDYVVNYCKKYTLLNDTFASKENVLRSLSDHDVLYFATHGISSEEKPMENSFLVLSDPLPYLTAKEIMELRNESYQSFPKLVILSACQTGLGKYLEAGIVGIARSFLIVGANHVIMSLWNVDDEATAYLMSRFAYYLNTKEELHFFTPSEQLRLAILDTMKKYKNPAYWASFTSFGVFH